MANKWKTLTTDDVSSKAWATFEKSKAMYKAYVAVRDEFEVLVKAEVPLPKGKTFAFGYNFGKPGVTIVDDDGKGRSNGAAKAPQSLADFLAAQA